ncbi:putative L-type lectin-domain containing receptor kinase II.2 [Citrus sinensis]|uniref:L-type lectin-domain containing receptor kinase II.2 n=1 Tax=Citrus sinensis TaxID=2711 RepID=A0ACB8IWV6_CITSI|nr:putative L-type lectin-domain containing receptor kinase II.2 [Citrus sinensis]
MAAALISLYFWKFLLVSCISVASAQDENQFIYHGFNESKLHLEGFSNIQPNGLLQMSNSSQLTKGHAFYPYPLNFNTSSPQSLSFSTNFVFAMVPVNTGGHGMAFLFSPSLDLSQALASAHLGLLNSTNNGQSTNHIIAVELDTVQSVEFKDLNGTHVGIDVNSLISNDSAPAAYFSDEGSYISLDLQSGNPMQIWIDYNGEERLLNVTLAPIRVSKPNRPLLSTPLDLSQILLDTMYVGFSASTGILKSNQYILGWSFSRIVSKPNSQHPPPPSLTPSASFSPFAPQPEKSKEKGQGPIIIVFPVVAVFAVALITISGAIYIVQKKKYEEVYEDWEREYGPQRFSYKDLYKATKGFKELIGKGGFGKKISHDSEQGMKEFVSEIVSMGALRHRNLVQLHGYCRRKQELLLVYNYMHNKSLDTILHSSTRPNLNWFQRFRILRGVASALLYLHEEGEKVVLHRDIKPGNILLDAHLNGKLGDFGMARLYDHGSIPCTTSLVGTLGYMAPELLRTGKADTRTDVFAFGVCMLEVACGRRPIEDGNINLVDWVIDCWKRGCILDVIDPRLEGLYVEEQMELVLKLGLFCSHPNPAARPNMPQLMQYLDSDAKFPDTALDSFMISVSTANNEASENVISFLALLGTSSSYTMSTIDSILVEGR